MEIKNATTVHRIWRDLPDAELLATFQYFRDADAFCKAVIEQQNDKTFLAYVDHYSGQMRCVYKANDERVSS